MRLAQTKDRLSLSAEMPTDWNLAQRSVQIPPSGVTGDLAIPASTRGAVIFAHGSGSSRLSTRNRFVAGVLQRAHFATLLLDLLTTEEEQIDLKSHQLRFDVGLLATRLVQATDWLIGDSHIGSLPLGYFGASTGAAAALVAAAQLGSAVRAVVSRGGRPDLAVSGLSLVKAPTLLIVGGNDRIVLALNERAYRILQCEKKLEIVAGATHLFEELGTLEQVATLAGAWFEQHLARD